MFINWDIAWHIEAAKRIGSGGDYLINLFDTSSPFVFIYFIPLVWLHSWLQLAYYKLTIIYILATTTLPLVLSYLVIFKTNHTFLFKRLLYYLIVILLLFVPSFHLGQREIVLITFYCPYFLYSIFSPIYPERLKINFPIIYLMVLLAAFGISQNLTYIAIPIVLDFFLILKFRNVTFHQLFFYTCMLFSILFVTLIYPNYFKVIVPMVLCFGRGFHNSIFHLLFQELVFICLISLVIFLFNIRKLSGDKDIILCFLAAVIAMLIFLLQLQPWYHHFYPALFFTVLLLGLLIGKLYYLPSANLISISMASSILITVFLITFFYNKNAVVAFNNPKDRTNLWINYAANHFANSKVLFLTIDLGPPYSIPLYTKAKIDIISPWSNPWMLPYIFKYKNDTRNSFCPSSKGITTVQTIATNAMAKNPAFIVVENNNIFLNQNGKKLDILEFFSQDFAFARLFKQYSIYQKFDDFSIYVKTSF